MLRLEAIEIVQGDWRLTADLALDAGQQHGADRPVRLRARARSSAPSPASPTSPVAASSGTARTSASSPRRRAR